MKKYKIRNSLAVFFLLITLVFVSYPQKLQAAVNSEYTFSQSVGTYTPITGGTVWQTGAWDDVTASIPIGFDFFANGQTISSVTLSTNGYIHTGTGSIGYTPISSTTAANFVASPFGRDLQGKSTSEIRYETSGTSPNRVFTVQWKDAKRYGSSYPDETLNFQIKLYQTSNKVELIYGDFVGSSYATPTHPQIGLRGAVNTDFLNRTTTTDWSTSTVGLSNTATMTLTSAVKPVNGLTYNYVNVFSTPPTFPTLTTQPASSIDASGVTLNGNITNTGGENATIRGFQYGLDTNYGITTTENGSFGASAYTANITGLTPNTTYHYRSYATNGVGQSFGSDQTFTTLSLSSPTVTTGGPDANNYTTVTLNGNITALGGNNVTTRGFEYGPTTSYGTTTTENGTFGIGSFSSSLTSLTPNTTYHYRSYATNITGISYGEDMTFLTTPYVWTERTSADSRSWYSIASSADGTKLAAVVQGGYIYISTDSGATWTERTTAGSRNWYSITSSSDGTKLAAGVNGGYIYTSTDSGATWTERTTAGSRSWYPITSSSDGTKLAAGVNGGYIYTSTDSGATWTERTSSGSLRWYSITSSSDGTKLAAVNNNNGYIYTSADSGATWTAQTSSGSRSWSSITSSSDGTKLAAVVSSGYIYTSADGGATWTQRTSAGSRNWYAISSSSDGTKLAAIVYGGYIYTYSPATSPALTTELASSVDASGVTLNGNITNTGGENPTVRGFQYGLTDSYGTNILEEGSFSTGAYTANLTGLTPNTTYHYRSYATNGVGQSFGSDQTFTTLSISSPIVTTGGPDANNYTTVTLNGNITALGGNNVTTRGFEYGPTTSYGTTTTENGTFGIGSFSSSLTSLTPNTTYHYRSYATNITGISYGEDMTFLTTPYVWTERTSAGSHQWYSITSSSDGTKLAAAVVNGYIYTSIDSGSTWTERTSAGSRSWTSITSSSDGTKLAAVANNGYIYTSGDSGSTWTERTSSGQCNWYSITSSSDGTKLAAVANNSYIYTSTDSGATWIARTSAGSRSWYSITSSSDGTKLAAGVNGGYIYTSTDSGATWTERTSAGSGYWRSITSSSDGTKLAVGVNGGYIYTSTDSGATWTERTSTGQWSWYSITFSSDGTKLAAGTNGYIYTSTDSGATWIARTSAGSRSWYSITFSSDGTRLAAVNYGGYIYTYGPATSPTLTTQSASSIDASIATLNGNITNTGGDNPTIRGFQYGLTDSYGTNILEEGSFGQGTYSLNITNLICETTYHFRAYATNGVGQSFGDDMTFTTSNCPTISSVTTDQATPIYSTSVTLNGNITDSGGEVSIRGFEYGQTDTYGETTIESGSFDVGSYSYEITNLTCNTLYHYRSYTINSAGTSYGDDMTFTTGACPMIPTLTTEQATSITTTTAILNGTITSFGGEEPNDYGFEFGETINYGTIIIVEAKLQEEPYSFSLNLDSLTCGNTYHYRSYATNSMGTGYGNDQTFTTSECPVAPYITNLTLDNKTSITVSVVGNTGNYYIENITNSTNSDWVTENTYQFTNLTCDIEYSFKVKGKDLDNVETIWSDIHTVMLPCIVIEAEGGLATITTKEDFEGGTIEDTLDTTTISGDLLLSEANSSGDVSFLSKWGTNGSGDGEFSNPNGITTDAAGNIYVADSYNHRIQKFSSDGTFISKWGIPGSADGEFVNPYGITTDLSGNIYVADTNNNRIQKFSSDGTFISKWGTSGSGDGEFSVPFGITTDASGNIYVVDSNNHRIQKFSSTGDFISKWGSYGSGDGEFVNPYGITTDLSGNIYVADTSNNRIQKFTQDGVYLNQFGGYGNSYISTLTKSISFADSWSWIDIEPLSVTRMASGSGVIDGKIYIAGGTDDWNDLSSLAIYDPVNDSWDDTKTSMSMERTTPLSVVYDDKLYIIGGRNISWGGISSMEVYDPLGDSWNTSLNSMSIPRIGPAGGYYNGKIYAVGGAQSSCDIFEISGEVYDIASDTWSPISPAPVEKMTGSTAQFINDIMYIAGGQTGCNTPFSNKLISYNPADDTWNTNLADMPSARSGGTSIAVDGKLYYIGGTSDDDWEATKDIYIYDPSLNTWTTYTGSLPTTLHRTSIQMVGDYLYLIGGRESILLQEGGSDWVSTAKTYKINKSDLGITGPEKKITQISWTSTTPPDTTVEIFYSLDDGITFTSLGTIAGTYDLPQKTTNTIKYKAELIKDANSEDPSLNTLTLTYTSENLSYEYNDTISTANFSQFFKDGEFNNPSGITTDTSGNIYVADTNNHRIQKFSSDGTFISKWGTPGSADGEFVYPYGLTTDSSGNIYVVDTYNNRVQKFEQTVSQSGYQPTGTFTSSVIDAGKTVTWTTFTVDEVKPTGTSITYQTRTGPTAIPNDTWSPWITSTGSITSPSNQYFQIKATLETTGDNTPVLHSITVNNKTTSTHKSTGSSMAVIATFQQEQQVRAQLSNTNPEGCSSTTLYSPLNGQKCNSSSKTSNPSDGQATPTITRVLKQGMQGDDVKALQTYLNTHGYIISLTGAGSLGNETTYFGLKTKQAVIKFQLANGLVGDGIVGKLTIDKLK